MNFRIFEAPESECSQGKLPIEESPWFFERCARIPLAHWELLIEFAKKVNLKKAKNLESYSVGSFEDDGYIKLPSSEMESIINFMEELKLELDSCNPIFSLKEKTFSEVYDEYENTEYQRMLDAVIAVYKESRITGKPICAYND